MVPRRLVWLVVLSLLFLPLAPALPFGGAHAQEEPAAATVTVPGPDAADTATETPTVTPTPTDLPATETPSPTPTEVAAPADIATPDGSATVTGTQPATETPTVTATATATPTVTPTATPIPAACTLLPASGSVGRTITLTCTGFQPGERVNLYWDRSSSTIIRAFFTADAKGGGSGSFKVPDAARGAHPVIAKGLTSVKKVIVSFTVVPSLSLDKRNGTVGTTLRVTLTGFGASDSVALTWRQSALSSVALKSLTVSRYGSGTVSVSVPRTPAGDHAVVGTGRGGGTAERVFTVTPDLKLSPTTGRIGSGVTVKFYGFGAGETIRVQFYLGATTYKTVASNVVASSTGTASVSFKVPDADEGAHRVAAIGSKGNTAARTYTIDEPGERWVEVNLSAQYMTVWEGDQVVNGTYVSTGRPGFETPTGTFYILVKYDSQTMAGTIGGESYYVPDVPWVMYFTNYGHAIHGAYWHNNFGYVMSHGCINLPTYNTPGWSYDFAEWLYYWLPYGARVVIHY